MRGVIVGVLASALVWRLAVGGELMLSVGPNFIHNDGTHAYIGLDFLGIWQHFTIPMSEVDEALFEDGNGFDGSSIRGWQPIHASDMLVIPDSATAVVDPFITRRTLSLICNIVDPITKENYSRDPRNIARKAEAYLKSTGVADTAFFGPEAEFFILDDVRWGADMSGSFVKIDSEEASWNTEKVYEGGNLGHRPMVKGGYFPVPPVDSLQDIRSAMCLALEQMGMTLPEPKVTRRVAEVTLQTLGLDPSQVDQLQKIPYLQLNDAG